MEQGSGDQSTAGRRRWNPRTVRALVLGVLVLYFLVAGLLVVMP